MTMAIRHLFVVPATGGTPRQLTDGQWHHNGVEWTPDSKQILFSSNCASPDAEYQFRESDIYSVNVDTGVIKQLTHPQGSRRQPARSRPTASCVAYVGLSTRHATPGTDSKLYVMNIDGTNPRLVSGDWDRSPQNIHVEGRRHRHLLQRPGFQETRTFTCCRWPGFVPTWCSRLPRAPTC